MSNQLLMQPIIKKLSVQVLGNPDGIKIQEDESDEEDVGEEGPPPVSCDLDPDSIFKMEYQKSEDCHLSSQYIMDSQCFKKGLKTYDITHIVK